MKLNAEIILDNLENDMKVELLGTLNSALVLERPKFYTGAEKSFCANELYIALADRLPARPKLSPESVIICVGDSMQVAQYKDRCTLLQIRERVDFFQVANLVHDIFNKYDAWNEKLLDILSGTASVRDMLEHSCGILENPMFVIDSDFRIVANAGYNELVIPNTSEAADAENLGLSMLAQYLEQREPLLDVKEPILLNILDTSTLSMNLFRNDIYIGCLTIDYRHRRHRPSDIPLVKHLNTMIVLALEKLSTAAPSEKSVLKNALRDLMDGLPTTSEQNRALENAGAARQYVCIKMTLGSRLAKLPMGYICNEIEGSFSGSIAFEHDGSVVGFIELDDAEIKSEGYPKRLQNAVTEYIQSMDMHAGVSDIFDNLFSARLFYRQACAALENGALSRPAERYFIFQDLALNEMIINSLGELPIEMYFTNGLRRLAQHDAESHLSYIDTLRVYLDHNMSISKTAAALYIHRSTLLERLARIERELDADLRDPDERLKISMLLKAMRVQESLRGKSI